MFYFGPITNRPDKINPLMRRYVSPVAPAVASRLVEERNEFEEEENLFTEYPIFDRRKIDRRETTETINAPLIDTRSGDRRKTRHPRIDLNI
jgi:hypothetical protein